MIPDSALPSPRISTDGSTQERQLLALSIETSKQQLATARMTHKKISESIDMRTTTIASIAGSIFAEAVCSVNPKIHVLMTAANCVAAAAEILAAAEALTSKQREMQEAKTDAADPGR